MYYEKYFSVGIYPNGLGPTGIFVKTFNDFYPRKWSKNLLVTNPVEGATKIIDTIEEIRKNLSQKDFYLKEVIVELPDENSPLLRKENDATHELVGILRYVYGKKFKGHVAIEDNLKATYNNSKNKRTVHELKAEAIMYAHFKEKEKGTNVLNAR